MVLASRSLTTLLQPPAFSSPEETTVTHAAKPRHVVTYLKGTLHLPLHHAGKEAPGRRDANRRTEFQERVSVSEVRHPALWKWLNFLVPLI